jgi:hypothetical protein
MINSDPVTLDAEAARRQDAEVNRILRAGPTGAIALAGVATIIVMLIWFAYYFLVFVPRAGAS